MKVLMIGGTGNISGPMTRLLVEAGHEVTLFNRGKSGSELPAGVHRILGDRSDPRSFELLGAKAGRFDCVIDMIAFRPSDIESDVRVFRSRIDQLIFCSTVDVYSKRGASYPIREDAQRLPSESFQYAYDKAACEELLFASHARGDFKVTILRPAATYREGWPPVHSFRGGSYHLDRIRKGKPIIIHGDGTSIWSACHAADVAKAFANAVGNPVSFGKSYNVTGEEWMTWDYYWQCAADAIGVPIPEIVHIPTDLLARVAPELAGWCKENFQYDNIFDNSASHDDLGFRYTIRWREGIKRSVDWILTHGGFEDSDNYPFYDRIVEAWRRASGVLQNELAGVVR